MLTVKRQSKDESESDGLLMQAVFSRKHKREAGKLRKVEVVEYNPDWVRQFELAANEIQRILGEECLAIHHIGSTSVHGLAAKPVIDLMPVVRDIDKVDGFISEMLELRYEAKGENGLAGRRYFQRGGEERTHHVHVYQEGSGEIVRHLAFRNYLRENPHLAKEYGTLKKELAKIYPYEIQKYIEGKEPLVLKIEKRAMGEI